MREEGNMPETEMKRKMLEGGEREQMKEEEAELKKEEIVKEEE